jgi:hypothetical protein
VKRSKYSEKEWKAVIKENGTKGVKLLMESEDIRCCNCAGNHIPNSPECLVRVKEFKVARVRAVQQVSYMEAR